MSLEETRRALEAERARTLADLYPASELGRGRGVLAEIDAAAERARLHPGPPLGWFCAWLDQGEARRQMFPVTTVDDALATWRMQYGGFPGVELVAVWRPIEVDRQ